MPDYSSFLRLFETFGAPQYAAMDMQSIRIVDSLWKSVMVDSGAATSTSSAATSAPTTQGPVVIGAAGAGGGVTPLIPPVHIGRTVMSTEDRWKIQAQLRRDETRFGRKEYNKSVSRAMKTTKGPGAVESFHAGRGRPIR